MAIRTELIEIDENFIKVHGYGKVGRYALITVSDTGEGIDEETRPRIFEPFFTTKEVGKGTGLGLAIAYGITKQHDGYIICYSEPKIGTTFYIYLPLIQTKVEDTKPVTISTVETGTEMILLAEDDVEVRKAVKEILTGSGYRVIEAVDGEDAISQFMKKRNKDRIQLLILDVIMPKKNGKEVYEEIKRERPDIKVLFTSGHTADLIHRKGILEGGSGFVLKPFAPHDLLRKVREVLGERT